VEEEHEVEAVEDVVEEEVEKVDEGGGGGRVSSGESGGS
jgi:hypothetical protein